MCGTASRSRFGGNDKPFIPRPYGIAVRKGDGEFIGWVNGQLQKIRGDGTYDRLWKKYFGEVEANLVKP